MTPAPQPHVCPGCRKLLEFRTEPPMPGDFSVCLGCGQIAMFDEHLALTPRTIDQIDPELRAEAESVQRRVAEHHFLRPHELILVNENGVPYPRPDREELSSALEFHQAVWDFYDRMHERCNTVFAKEFAKAVRAPARGRRKKERVETTDGTEGLCPPASV